VCDRDANVFAHIGGQIHLGDESLRRIGKIGIGEDDALGLALGARGKGHLRREIIKNQRVVFTEPAAARIRNDALLNGYSNRLSGSLLVGETHQKSALLIECKNMLDIRP
jgi:hypothetical protein